MRTMFAVTRGLFAPESFKWVAAPELLTINDLWEACRTMPPGLLIRVRTESEPGAEMTTADKVESVIGLIDSTTRWRASLGMFRSHISAVRNESLSQALWASYGMMLQKHPAAITTPERQGVIKAISTAVESLPTELMQSVFEGQIAASAARFVMADNDVEAAYAVPFVQALALSLGDGKDRDKVNARMATIETLAASALMSAAHDRLAERAPEWLYVPPPGLAPTGSEPEGEREREVEKNDSDKD